MPRPSLSRLSDEVLLSHLHKLVAHEKQTTLSILLHLAEVDRRDLYLKYGFSSLFDYSVGALRYSRSAAGRRITTARCIHRYPEVYDLLESGEVNLSTIGLVAPILDESNKDLLLREIGGKTQRQVESIVARYKPPITYRDRVRPVRVAVPQTGQNAKDRRNPLIFNSRCGSAHRTNCGIVDPGNQEGQRAEVAVTHDACAEAEPPHPTKPANNHGATKTERRLLIQFLANEEFMAKLEEVKSLLSNKLPNGTFENVFEALMDEFIDRHSPTKREQRREKRKARAKKPGKRANKNDHPSTTPRVSRRGPLADTKRHVPAALRDRVYVRDDERCTYVGANGKRCGSTHNLQIDHIYPVARGGSNTLSNLRLLCGKHNRLEAIRILGEGVVIQHYKRE